QAGGHRGDDQCDGENRPGVLTGILERHAERDDQQEGEHDLHTGLRHPKFLKQFEPVPVEPFSLVLVPRVLRFHHGVDTSLVVKSRGPGRLTGWISSRLFTDAAWSETLTAALSSRRSSTGSSATRFARRPR